MTKTRVQSIDLLKGLVMVIMALDHVRDYFHYSSFFFDPTDPALTTLPIFFTRFVTNFCAPAFSFLAGVSAYLVGKRKNASELSSFLLKRGLWLIFIEVVVMNFGWHFDIYFRNIALQVIWVLGISMVLLAGLIHLPRNYLIFFCCLLIFGHNLLDSLHFDGNILWTLLHERKRYADIIPGHVIGSSYAIIPWVAVMSLGYCFGPFYNPDYPHLKRKRIFNLIGIAALAVLLVIRGTNIYGDTYPWKNYGSTMQNLFSFLNFNKYPPSLSFLLATLGPSFLFLANSEKLKGRVVNFFCVFGRVPFFYYIIHIYLIHLLALILAGFSDFGWRKMILPAMPFRVEALKGFGFNLVTVYLIWIAIVLALFPLCKSFDKYKQAHKEKWWLSYL
jgi:uncharacterized membrane protein